MPNNRWHEIDFGGMSLTVLHGSYAAVHPIAKVLKECGLSYWRHESRSYTEPAYLPAFTFWEDAAPFARAHLGIWWPDQRRVVR